jgi:hypothetical protein
VIKLDWADLLIEDSALDHKALLEDWRWLLHGPFRVIAGSKFGDWFVQRPDGRVEILDAIEGSIREVAPSHQEFQRLINRRENQEEWLLSALVVSLHEKGLVPGPGQCYGFKMPPVLGGEATSDNVEVMDLKVWVSISAQLHQQLHDLPEGTRITEFKFVERSRRGPTTG